MLKKITLHAEESPLLSVQDKSETVLQLVRQPVYKSGFICGDSNQY